MGSRESSAPREQRRGENNNTYNKEAQILLIRWGVPVKGRRKIRTDHLGRGL